MRIVPVHLPDETNEPKSRPPAPTPVRLPTYSVTPRDFNWLSDITIRDLHIAYAATHPSKWSSSQHHLLGVELRNDQAVETMLPNGYIPSREWQQIINLTETQQAAASGNMQLPRNLSNGKSVPGRDQFHTFYRELNCNRDQAMNVLMRRGTRSYDAVKIVYFRKFWMSLDIMSRYWDTSKDNYQPQNPSQSFSSDIDHDEIMEKETRQVDGKAGHNDKATSGDQFFNSSDSSLLFGQASSKVQQKLQSEVKDYYGIRRSTGKDMPNNERNDTVTNLLEPIACAMGCHYEISRGGDGSILDPKRFVEFQGARMQVPVSGILYRIPQDPKLAREGWNEGPILAVSSRQTLEFSDSIDDEEPLKQSLTQSDSGLQPEAQSGAPHKRGHGMEKPEPRHKTTDCGPVLKLKNVDVMDASHELGVLLMLAQFRQRNSKSEAEPKVGQGQWWAERPRFGSHQMKGEEIGVPMEAANASSRAYTDTVGVDFVHRNEDAINGVRDSVAPVSDIGSRKLERDRKIHSNDTLQPDLKKKAAISKENKNKLLCKIDLWRRKRDLSWATPRPVWDAKTHYLQVGKEPEQDFDHVYLISSVFHHISILCMRVHPSMLDIIKSSSHNMSLQVLEKVGLHRYGLYVQRSKWFDLLRESDRVEAMCAVWGVVAYMMRDTSNGHSNDKEFVRQIAQAGMLAQASLRDLTG